ncbi:MAG: Coproporphyrinogen oxidase and related Fe-S oxidoreductase [Clostridiales bacterium]|jgi:oxygen-independent coproporphyrinogen-3 oxidase|nr:Coproporphyrinogen oxidase and related Fe-S oxidoreductase [Clostridiales bacterium]
MIKMIFSNHNFAYDLTNLYSMFYKNESFEVSDETTEEEKHILAYMEGDIFYLSINIEKKQEYSIAITRGPKKIEKNAIKRFVYDCFSEYTGKQLEWGVLTGIRPTKIAMEALENGKSNDQVHEILRNEYYVSNEKIEIMLEVANKEFNILKKIDEKNSYSLYIGIPFCPTKCLYCSFTSYPIDKWSNRVDDYITALIKELKEIAILCRDKKLVTLYIGGGTPTSINHLQLKRLFEAIEDIFPLENLLEYTVEAGRPDTITREKLEVIKKYGISRLSINPQSMQQKTLDLIGRRHSVGETIAAFKLAREVGFDNINMDLIIGLPEETTVDIEDTLIQLEDLSPENLTVHALALKRASRLAEKINEYNMTVGNEAKEMQSITWNYAKSKDLKPYYLYRQKSMIGNLENIGYAKEGMECIYNILIMEERHTIMAAGAGASTKQVFKDENRIERIENVKSVDDYITRIDEMIDRKKKAFNI